MVILGFLEIHWFLGIGAIETFINVPLKHCCRGFEGHFILVFIEYTYSCIINVTQCYTAVHLDLHLVSLSYVMSKHCIKTWTNYHMMWKEKKLLKIIIITYVMSKTTEGRSVQATRDWQPSKGWWRKLLSISLAPLLPTCHRRMAVTECRHVIMLINISAGKVVGHISS